MVDLPQKLHLFFQGLDVFDIFFANNFDDSIGVGWYFEESFEDYSETSLADGLCYGLSTLGLNS